jgi:hypothetical protein
LPNWQAAQTEDWLGRWAMNLMLINVSTRKLRSAVRLPEGDLPAVSGDGTSKSAASRQFVALSAARMAAWMTADRSQLDLLAIQIDGLHVGDELVLVAALGIDADGNKHPLGLMEGATENAAVVQALIDKARARPRGVPPVHRRWHQGAEQGYQPLCVPKTQIRTYSRPPLSNMPSGCTSVFRWAFVMSRVCLPNAGSIYRMRPSATGH